jgi:transposase-like protein
MIECGHKLNCAHNLDYGHKNSTSHFTDKRGPYRQHSTEFKRAIVAKSFVEGASVSRLAREFNINANQVFTWRRKFYDLHEARPSDLTTEA